MKYDNLSFTHTFMETFASKDFGPKDRKAMLKALRLLDEDEQHPSLRVHKLTGDRVATWSASASKSLRLTYECDQDDHKWMLTCSHHYDR